MAIKYLGCSTKRLTQELALDIATMPKCRSERPIRASLKSYLETELETGRFYSPRWAVAFMGIMRFRVNGQHSSTVLAEANGNFPNGLDVIIDEYRVDTEQDLAELFDRFDPPHSVRTRHERANARWAIEDDLKDVSLRTVEQTIGGIAYTVDPYGNYSNAGSRESLIHAHKPFILWAAPFAKTRKLDRVSVIACIFKTWQKDPIAAAEFWKLVIECSHPNPKHPTRALADLLLEETYKRQGNSTTKRWTKHEIHVKCIRAWNAWRTNQPSTLLKVLDGDVKKFPELA